MEQQAGAKVSQRRQPQGRMFPGLNLRLLSLLLAVLFLAGIVRAEKSVVIASFEEPDSAQDWVSVNDGVMGGVSMGTFERTERETLLFTGELSLENNGGFASIRMRQQDLGLAGAKGITIRARGDGRTYWVGLRTARQPSASSYRAFMETTKDEFLETFIPFSDFKLEAFGRRVPSGALDPAAVASVGITVADGIEGPFRLELESIKAVFGEGAASPETTEQPLEPAELIQLAIERGVPLFNNGNPAACAAIYEVTCEALRTMPELTEESRAILREALVEMRRTESESERAWILRRALDRVLAETLAGK